MNTAPEAERSSSSARIGPSPDDDESVIDVRLQEPLGKGHELDRGPFPSTRPT